MKPLWNKRLVMLLITFCALWGKAQAEQPIDTSSSANILVTNRSDSGPGSFRQAITTSNSNGMTDVIVFHDSLKGTTIQPLSPLPSLNEGGTTINGDIDGNGTPDIEIDCSLAGQTEGINILSSNNVIRGLVINRTHFAGIGIHGSGASYNTIAGNYIGLDKTGTLKLGTSSTGIWMGEGANRNTIGGTHTSDRNITSGNYYNGIATSQDSDNNQIINNYVGTDKTGAVAFGNGGHGINILSRYNLVKNNLVSGSSGVWIGGIILYGTQAYENTVVGNFIGTDVSGTIILGNTGPGVGIYSGAHNNIIGGSIAGEGNIISGNGIGVGIDGSGSDSNAVLGNLIGADISGTDAIPNDHGVVITGGAKSNTIGGIASGAGNLISGNKYKGIEINGNGSDRNIVLGNLIGTNVYGVMALPNADGMAIYGGAKSNIIGGKVPGAGNLISGNAGQWGAGIIIAEPGTDSNLVLGNKIGTGKGGTYAIGNRNDGVNINNGPKHNQIGGSDSLAGNLISGNGDPAVQWSGIGISIWNSDSNLVRGNIIGLDVSGTSAVPNLTHGVSIGGGGRYNIIGGLSPEERNVISGNGTRSGSYAVMIHEFGTDQNRVLGNYIGTDVSGTKVVGNRDDGVRIEQGACFNKIGSTNPAGRNVISGNSRGVGIVGTYGQSDTLSAYNEVIGNYIGTDVTGTFELGNRLEGILIIYRAASNLIGGTDPLAGNLISNNKGPGIKVSGEGNKGNRILGNRIHSNSGNGIAFLSAGADGNLLSGNSIFDNAGSGIYYYPDYKFPFFPPVILSVTGNQISGYASLPNGSKVELFSDQEDEGKIYIGSATVSSNSFTYSGTIPAWTHLTATGIDTAGNTSSFSIPFFSRPVQTIPYFNDFEANDGNFAHQGTWAWGEPVYGPKQAYSGRKVWATTLDSVTLNYNYQYLELPPIYLSSPTCACLSFAHWYSFEKLYDGGNLKISSDGGKHFTLITPDSGYDCTLGYVMLGESTFNGESGRYIREFFNLGPYANDTVIIRFHFASDPWIQESGWYIDDLSLFLRGDANSDKQLTVADVVYLVSYIFKRGAQPRPLEAGDANRDGKVNIADIVYLVAYLFKAGAPPAC